MLSILIPTYNYNVLPLVQELHRQASREGISFEVIVLDDHSTSKSYDGNNSKTALMENVFFLQNKTNQGRTLTRKLLAETAKYDTLLFLDADVEMVSHDFIKNYIAYIGRSEVVIGGIAYKNEQPESDKALRYKYGRLREQRTAEERSKNVYGAVLSGNLLVDKAIFMAHNFSQNANLYGLDIYFAYSLYKSDVPVVHIDNPVYHTGLETDDAFFKKSLEAVKSRKQLLAGAEGVENINGLLKHYKTLKKYRLTLLAAFLFKLIGPMLKKQIFKKDPSLFCLDLYRLGYICAIK
jgi:glycosyltransferase involved in cell wall biosynthesis